MQVSLHLSLGLGEGNSSDGTSDGDGSGDGDAGCLGNSNGRGKIGKLGRSSLTSSHSDSSHVAGDGDGHSLAFNLGQSGSRRSGDSVGDDGIGEGDGDPAGKSLNRWLSIDNSSGNENRLGEIFSGL